jgi:hypothetical protein
MVDFGVWKKILFTFIISIVISSVLLLSLFYFSFNSLKVIMALFLFVFGFIAVAAKDAFLKSIFLIVTAVVLLLFFDEFKEYALVLVLVLLSMFLGKTCYKLLTEVFK